MYGFCLRDNSGDLIYMQKVRVWGLLITLKQRKTWLWKPLSIGLEKKLNLIQMEIDSLVVKNMIIRNWRIPWDVVEIMEEIHDNMVRKIIVNV